MPIGNPDYVNKDCWLANTLGYPPAKRCCYCELKFKECPFTLYLGVSLALCIFAFAIFLFSNGEITRADIFVVFVMVLVYGYFSTKSTEKVIEGSFAERRAKIALEKSKADLEIRVAERTKELEELTKSLGVRIDTKTVELKDKLKELEKINRLAVDRELRMIELKGKIKELEEKIQEVKKSQT